MDGIYSWRTYNTYKDKATAFAEWAKKNYGCKTLESAKTYIQAYLGNQVDLGQSVWKIKLKASAICKLYGASTEELNLHTPERKRENIKRSRFDCENDKHVSKKRNKDLIGFCNGTGLRRHEVAAVYPKNIKYDTSGLIVHVKQGKGGKSRNVPVLVEFYPDVEKFIGLPPNDPIFMNIPKNIDIHSLEQSLRVLGIRS